MSVCVYVCMCVRVYVYECVCVYVCVCGSQMAERGSQMAEQFGNRASNQKVTGSIPGRAK